MHFNYINSSKPTDWSLKKKKFGNNTYGEWDAMGRKMAREKFGFNLRLEEIGSGRTSLDIAASRDLIWDLKKNKCIYCSIESVNQLLTLDDLDTVNYYII